MPYLSQREDVTTPPRDHVEKVVAACIGTRYAICFGAGIGTGYANSLGKSEFQTSD
jgi:hypothetical protein